MHIHISQRVLIVFAITISSFPSTSFLDTIYRNFPLKSLFSYKFSTRNIKPLLISSPQQKTGELLSSPA